MGLNVLSILSSELSTLKFSAKSMGGKSVVDAQRGVGETRQTHGYKLTSQLAVSKTLQIIHKCELALLNNLKP